LNWPAVPYKYGVKIRTLVKYILKNEARDITANPADINNHGMLQTFPRMKI
jgi:hypothetical protein